MIRQQRHLGTRVIVSTQEPTVRARAETNLIVQVIPSTILDLASLALVFGFTAPAWATHISAHLGGLALGANQLYEQAVSLRPGEAIAFSPSAYVQDGADAVRLGSGWLRIRTRKRVTMDGGVSVLAVG